MEASILNTELSIYQEHRDEWVRDHTGTFVVIQDKTVVDGFFDSYADAVRAGVRSFGAQRSFLVKEVRSTDPVYFFSI